MSTSVEAHSTEFKKELGLRDLVLTQVLYVVGLAWVGVAAKLGPSHVVFWLAAMALFYVPSAVVVTYLNRLMPLEGGLYQWAKLGFNGFVGFLVGWNLWLFAIVNTSEIGLTATTNLAYALGPKAAWMADTKWFIAVATGLIIGVLVLVSVLGLGVGKWLHNAGGAVMVAIFAALLVLPLLAVARGTLPTYQPLHLEMPAISLLSLNILGKIGFGALGGFEYVAILAGEARDPERTIRRSVAIAAPLIALMFVFGTSSVLAFVQPSDVDLISPIGQVLTIGFGAFGSVVYLISVLILLTLGIRIAQASFLFAATTRLPMVAGWDRILPEWFSRLHARYRTPVNSIVFVGATTLVLALAGLVGVGHQEAFQLLWNTGGVFYALTYLVMFALPIVGLRGVVPRPSLGVRVAAVSGLLMTVLFLATAVFPIVAVVSRLAFAAKIAGLIVVANGIGVLVYSTSRRGLRGRG